MERLIISVLLIFVSSNSLGNSSFGTQRITAVTVHDSGNLIVTIAGNSHSETCPDENRVNTLVLNPDSPHLKEMYATSLAAYLTGKAISGWVNGCVTFWGYNLPKATVISIHD